ncbi:uncharacterized protein LOC131632522 [Vicia villosa]|uniref:uncharacterized protein LOC131632522 n=1 Tax=Vicia villosa TaxID=3911 RepID=UPI00273C8067|nr:uncharacterized protein LOC131632522 [Vicia villosa]
MIIGSLNVRGCGSLVKRKQICRIIKQGNADCFLIQESKVKIVDRGLINILWGQESVGWSFTGSDGKSGGLITLWKESCCEVILSFNGVGFLGTKLRWRGNLYYVVNIYSPCDLASKRALWKTLMDLKLKFSDGEWCIAGDFNSVVSKKERMGRALVVKKAEMRDFARFIGEIGLVDVPFKGKLFSWFSGDGRCMSRLDRFLLEDSIVDRWGVVGQMIGSRDISDHCPIWIISDKADWGPKPFKIVNAWFDNKEFLPFVEKEWLSLKVSGRADFVLKEKFRLLKVALRRWITEVFGKIDLEIEGDRFEINEADSLLGRCADNEI